MEMQQTLQGNEGMLFDGFMVILLGVMLLAGMLGGLANYYLSERYANGSREVGKYVVLGIVASLIVPLLLNMLSSNLIAQARVNPVDLYVFAGVCLIFVVLTRRWFENLAQKLLNQVQAVQDEVSQIKSLQSLAEKTAPELESLPRVESEITASPEAAQELTKLSYNDIELMRAVSDGRYAYGNISGIAGDSGLSKDFINERLVVLKQLGLLELKINEKNVLHWFLAPKGKQFLGEVMAEKED